MERLFESFIYLQMDMGGTTSGNIDEIIQGLCEYSFPTKATSKKNNMMHYSIWKPLTLKNSS